MKCVIVTPEKTIFDKEVTFVTVPLYDGEYGIAVNHTPVIGRIGAGELRITLSDDKKVCFYIEGGFVEVLANTVTILTNQASSIENMDKAKAQDNLKSVLARSARSNEQFVNKVNALKKARAKLHFVEKYSK